jgi:glycosyltransferase involved in cell wall biosynthesis
VARVFWYGDAGCHTGFARVTHAIAGRLVQKGHEVHVLALNYPGDWVEGLEGLRLYKANSPDPADLFGARKIAAVLEKVQPDVTIVLHDPAHLVRMLLRNPADPGRVFMQAAPIIAYMPVDGYNYPPEITDILPQIVNPVAMATHGLSVFPRAQLAYHGIDPTHFWAVADDPIPFRGTLLEDKRDCKIALGFDPDKKLVLRVDKNSGRKDFAATIHALGPILEKDRDVQLHLHASTDPQMPGSNIPVLLTRYDLAPGQVKFPDLDSATLGWDTAALNVLYNAADLFVTTSRGEGFGLTIAEALQCGVPVIGQNVSSIPEVIGPGGIVLEPDRLITVPAGHDLWLPNIEAFTEATARMLSMSDDERRAIGEAGKRHVSGFRWDPTADRFHDFVELFARGRASEEATVGS